MLLAEVDGIEQSQNFIDIAAEVEIVDGGVFEHTRLVDNKESTQRDARAFNQHPVVSRNLLVKIRDQRIIDALDAAFFARSVRPGLVREVRIHGATDNLGISFLEFSQTVGERGDFGGTHKREIQRVEEQNDLLTLVFA